MDKVMGSRKGGFTEKERQWMKERRLTPKKLKKAVRREMQRSGRINPRTRRKKKSTPKRAGLVGAKRVQRNITPFLQGALWGAGYSAFEGTKSALKRKKKAKVRSRGRLRSSNNKKPRRNPEGMTAVAVGRGSRKAVIAGPAGYINTLTRDLRQALGSSAVTAGKIVRQ